MAKSKGVGRGGSRPGAGRKPKALARKQKLKPPGVGKIKPEKIKPEAPKGQRGGARPGSGRKSKIDKAVTDAGGAKSLGEVLAGMVADAKSKLDLASEQTPAQQLEADAWATLKVAMGMVAVATAPAVTAARVIITQAAVDGGKQPGDKLGKKQVQQKTASDRASSGSRFAPPPPPGTARH